LPALLSVNNYYYLRGGAETIFLSHNELIGGAGWDVIPFAMKHPDNRPTVWSEYFVDELEYGEKYSPLEKIKLAAKSLYSLESRRNIHKLIKAVRPDICHAHNIYHHISPSILGLLRDNNIPVVMTLHDLKLACPAYRMLVNGEICERCKNGKLYNVVLNKCMKGSRALSTLVMTEAVLHKMLGSYTDCVSRFIVPSRFYLNKFVEWGWNPDKFVYIPNFINIHDYVPNYASGDYFLYLGRLSFEKGAATLIKAAADAGVPLKIAGTGPEEMNLKKLAAENGGRVDFLGYLSGERLRDVLRSSRAVVLPSEWYENAPLSLLEAYALGKPVIGAKIGGIPELISEGETGFTFIPGSVDDLSVMLSQVAALAGERLVDMGRVARERAEREYDSSIYRSRILDLYENIMRS